MELLYFKNGQPPERLETLTTLPSEGVVWADFVRSEAQHWECWAEPLVGEPIDPKHVADSLNAEHPSFFDGTPGYDMLIFQGLGPSAEPFPLETRTAAFFLFDRLLVTVRAPDNVSFGMAKQRLVEGRVRASDSVLMLAHAVLDTMIDRYLQVREPLDRRFTELQDELLDDKNPMEDWRALLEARREARRLESLSEDQLEAIGAWRRGTRTEWTTAESVRIRDLSEHIDRVLAHASNLERDTEAAVQLHFAVTSHRTNQTVQLFTVVSVVFMPMMLVTSIWGMNFDHMPELHWRYGYYLALGITGAVGLLCWRFFKRRRYL